MHEYRLWLEYSAGDGRHVGLGPRLVGLVAKWPGLSAVGFRRVLRQLSGLDAMQHGLWNRIGVNANNKKLTSLCCFFLSAPVSPAISRVTVRGVAGSECIFCSLPLDM